MDRIEPVTRAEALIPDDVIPIRSESLDTARKTPIFLNLKLKIKLVKKWHGPSN